MAIKSRQRLLWTGILACVLLCLLLVCGGFAYVAYRSVNTLVETYEPASLPNSGEVTIAVEVRPQTRINDGYGDRLVGPPYELMFTVRDASGQLTRARLHSVRAVVNENSQFSALVTNGDNPVREFGFALLYARIEHESLGEHPQLFADIEFVTPARSERREITFSLRRGSRASLNIP